MANIKRARYSPRRRPYGEQEITLPASSIEHPTPGMKLIDGYTPVVFYIRESGGFPVIISGNYQLDFWLSEDKGETWDKHTLPFASNSITIIPAFQAFYAGDCYVEFQDSTKDSATGAKADTLHLYKSVDRTRNWTHQWDINLTSDFPNGDVSYFWDIKTHGVFPIGGHIYQVIFAYETRASDDIIQRCKFIVYKDGTLLLQKDRPNFVLGTNTATSTTGWLSNVANMSNYYDLAFLSAAVTTSTTGTTTNDGEEEIYRIDGSGFTNTPISSLSHVANRAVLGQMVYLPKLATLIACTNGSANNRVFVSYDDGKSWTGDIGDTDVRLTPTEPDPFLLGPIIRNARMSAMQLTPIKREGIYLDKTANERKFSGAILSDIDSSFGIDDLLTGVNGFSWDFGQPLRIFRRGSKLIYIDYQGTYVPSLGA